MTQQEQEIRKEMALIAKRHGDTQFTLSGLKVSEVNALLCIIDTLRSETFTREQIEKCRDKALANTYFNEFDKMLDYFEVRSAFTTLLSEGSK